MRIHQVVPKIYHTYSKIWVNRDWVIRFLGFFFVISEVGSQIYIANSAIFKIYVFSATFWHEITMFAIDIDKKRFRTLFLTLKNHFENRPSTRLNFPQHLKMTHRPLAAFWGPLPGLGNGWYLQGNRSLQTRRVTLCRGRGSSSADGLQGPGVSNLPRPP